MVLAAALVTTGVIDLRQKRQALRRNYPILAHFRYFFESIRPEIRQYFLEDDTDAKPFSRNQRSIVYQRAKQETDKRPFGTQLDVYQAGYEWINHSIAPAAMAGHDFRVSIGNHPDCPRAQPYEAQRIQYLRHEFRFPVRQRDSGPEWRRQTGWLHARHRRRFDQPLPP